MSRTNGALDLVANTAKQTHKPPQITVRLKGYRELDGILQQLGRDSLPQSHFFFNKALALKR